MSHLPESTSIGVIVHEVNHSLGCAGNNRHSGGWRGFNEALTEYHAKQMVSPNYKTPRSAYDYNASKINELKDILVKNGYGDSTMSYFDKNNPGTQFFEDLGELMGEKSRNIVIANMDITDGGRHKSNIEMKEACDRIEFEIGRTKLLYGMN